MRNNLNKIDAIRVEQQLNSRRSSLRSVYVFKCRGDGCQREIRARDDSLSTHSGKCRACIQKKRPHESIYLGLFRDHRKIPVALTYDEFTEFMKIKNCHYCNSSIIHHEYGQIGDDFKSRAYHLDRKDPTLGYSKENCAVCCFRCNKFKGAMDYGEFIALCGNISEIFKKRIGS